MHYSEKERINRWQQAQEEHLRKAWKRNRGYKWIWIYAPCMVLLIIILLWTNLLNPVSAACIVLCNVIVPLLIYFRHRRRFRDMDRVSGEH